MENNIKEEIKNSYKTKGAKYIANKFNISINTVYSYSSRMKILKPNIWSNKELLILKNNYRGKTSLSRIQLILTKNGYTRTKKSIYEKALKENIVNNFRYEFLSVNDIKNLLGFSIRKIYNLIQKDKINSIIIEKKRYFKISDIKKFMKKYTNLWNYNLINLDSFSLIYLNDNIFKQKWFIDKKEKDLKIGIKKIWTTKEEIKLVNLYNDNIPINKIMYILDRKPNSIYNKIDELKNRGFIKKSKNNLS